VTFFFFYSYAPCPAKRVP